MFSVYGWSVHSLHSTHFVKELGWNLGLRAELQSLSKNGKKENVPTFDVHNLTCIGVKIKKKKNNKYQDVVVIRIYNFAQETKLIWILD